MVGVVKHDVRVAFHAPLTPGSSLNRVCITSHNRDGLSAAGALYQGVRVCHPAGSFLLNFRLKTAHSGGLWIQEVGLQGGALGFS